MEIRLDEENFRMLTRSYTDVIVGPPLGTPGWALDENGRGKWIGLEAGEGSGKTTQTPLLVERLGAAGLDVYQTKAPGGTPIGVRLRQLLVDGAAGVGGFGSQAALLEEAIHVADLVLFRQAIEENLAAGRWVVSDRSHYSSYAYSSWGKENPKDWEALFAAAMAGLEPDLVLWLDIDLMEGRRRANVARGRDAISAYDNADMAFYTRIRNAYEHFDSTLDFFRRVDVNGLSVEEVTNALFAEIASMLPEPTVVGYVS
jgi:dTMP kinase